MNDIIKCNICGKLTNENETNDSFPINYFGELARVGCCNECNTYVIKCRKILATHPDYLTSKFSKLLTLEEIRQICK